MISIVSPFYNEKDIILKAVNSMVANLANDFKDWELILVDDGSNDGSIDELLNSKIVNNKNIRIITCPYNQGRGRALKNGIDSAVGDIIVTTEIDCSWGDHIAKELVEKIYKDNLDVVIASPHLPGGKLINVPFIRIFLTKVGNYLINLFFISGITMNTGMTRAYRKEVIQPLICYENGKDFHLEVLLKLNILGFRIGEIPATLEWKDNKLSKSFSKKRKKSSTKIFNTIFTHLKFLATAKPRKNFAYLAIISTFIGTFFFGWAIKNIFVNLPSLFLAILSLQFFLFSFIFFGFAVIFYQSRELLREEWVKYYSGKKPPNILDYKEIKFNNNS